jgi:hypothetical protein
VSEGKKTVEQLLLDLKKGKYGLVSIARDWLTVLRKGDEGVNLSEAELVRKSLEDILSGKVDEDEIKAALNKILKLNKSEDGKEEKLASKGAGKKGGKSKE